MKQVVLWNAAVAPISPTNINWQKGFGRNVVKIFTFLFSQLVFPMAAVLTSFSGSA